jgi:hypothetical protein
MMRMVEISVRLGIGFLGSPLGGRRRKKMLLRGPMGPKGRNSRATNAGSAFRAP